jgi:hypothetical protein
MVTQRGEQRVLQTYSIEGYCARAANGQAPANPPTSPMNLVAACSRPSLMTAAYHIKQEAEKGRPVSRTAFPVPR